MVRIRFNTIKKKLVGQTGRFTNAIGKSQVIDFKMNEVSEVADEEALQYLWEVKFNGLGNTYNSKGKLNEDFVGASNEFKFYTNGTDVLVFKPTAQKLDESVQTKEKPAIDENFEKIKHLTGYNPNDYIKTDRVKVNRGF